MMPSANDIDEDLSWYLADSRRDAALDLKAGLTEGDLLAVMLFLEIKAGQDILTYGDGVIYEQAEKGLSTIQRAKNRTLTTLLVGKDDHEH